MSSVTFVTDYLQLDFSGPRLTLYVWPDVRLLSEPQRSLGDNGFRDAMCLLIDSEVRDVRESTTEGLILCFDLGELQVNPEPSQLTGPEIAMYQSGSAELMVWRPGEGPFALLA
jgi:hypothetical protein